MNLKVYSMTFTMMNYNDYNDENEKRIYFMYVRPFHYPEDHGGVKPKEFSIYVGLKPKFLE